MKQKSKKQIAIGLIFVSILVVIDQITKNIAVLFLKDQNDIPIIPEVFELRYLENTSAAFGMDPVSLLHKIFQFEIFKNNPRLFLEVRMGFFYIITICVCIFLIYLFTKGKKYL